VSKQIDITGDGILGRDFLQRTRAQICYENRTLTLHYAGKVVHKKLCHAGTKENFSNVDQTVSGITLQPRSETIVRLPVVRGTVGSEGSLEKTELIPGVYMAESLVRITDGRVFTSILNTREERLELARPTVRLSEVVRGDVVGDPSGDGAAPCESREESTSEATNGLLKPRGKGITAKNLF
jgi:hypothetical protein